MTTIAHAQAGRPNGFTIMEILVSTGILSILLLGITAFNKTAFNSQRHSHNFTGGITLAQNQLESYKAILSDTCVFDSLAELVATSTVKLPFKAKKDTIKNTQYLLDGYISKGTVRVNTLLIVSRSVWLGNLGNTDSGRVCLRTYIRRKS